MAWVCAVLLTCTCAGVERRVSIAAPASVEKGSPVTVTLVAETDAGDGERIGLFQADFSLDGGRTWVGLCYLADLARSTRQERTLPVGADCAEVRVRLRVAFRQGLAGDVDYRGGAIRWKDSWEEWKEPPARTAKIAIVAKQ